MCAGARHLSFEIQRKKVENKMDKEKPVNAKDETKTVEEPEIIEEIVVEELSIDGVCGVY